MYQIPVEVYLTCTQIHATATRMQVASFCTIVNVITLIYILNPHSPHLFMHSLNVKSEEFSLLKLRDSFIAWRSLLIILAIGKVSGAIKQYAGECKLFRPGSSCFGTPSLQAPIVCDYRQ